MARTRHAKEPRVWLVLLALAAVTDMARANSHGDTQRVLLQQHEQGFGSSPTVFGIGPGLFSMLFIGAFFLLLCFCAWFSSKRMLVFCVTFWIYVLLILFFLLARKRDPGSPKDPRPVDWTIGWRVLTCLFLFPGCCLALCGILKCEVMMRKFAMPEAPHRNV